MMMHILGEFPGFVHDSFSFDFPGWKGKISQNTVIVCIIELFTHSFAWTGLEILRWLFHGKVVVLHHEAGSVEFSSSVVYKHSLPGTSFKVFYLSPKPFTAAVGEALTSLPACCSACIPALIMTVMQTGTLLLFQRQLTFYNLTLGWHLRI